MRLLIIISLVFSAGSLRAADATLKVFTYNLGLLRDKSGLSRVLGKADKNDDLVPAVEARMAVIPERLSKFVKDRRVDILVLQEVWEEEHAAKIKKELGDDYSFFRPEKPAGAAIGNGLLIATRVQTIAETTDSKKFEKFKKSFGGESLAVKGFAMTKVKWLEVKNPEFVILGTHMHVINVDEKGVAKAKGEVAAHKEQTDQIMEAINKLSEDKKLPALIIGDLNVGKGLGEENFDYMLDKKLGFFAACLDKASDKFVTWTQKNPLVKNSLFFANDPDAIVDHVLTRNGKDHSWKVVSSQVAFDVEEVEIVIKPQTKDEKKIKSPLSDHYGALAELSLE